MVDAVDALRRGRQRAVCRMPVFPRGAGATENSLIGTGRSLVVENNYGYRPPVTAIDRDRGRAIIPAWPWPPIVAAMKVAPTRLVKLFA